MSKNIILKSLGMLVGIIITAIGYILDVRNIVHGPYIYIVGGLIFLVYIFRLIYKYEIELDIYRNSHPNIKIKGCEIRKNVKTTDFFRYSPTSIDSYEINTGGTVDPKYYLHAYRELHGTTDNTDPISTTQSYAVILFTNDPIKKMPINDAIEVIARINFFDESNIKILDNEIKGLWDWLEPTRIIDPIEDELTKITIPSNGDERILCVALKNREDDDCYAYAFNSYGKTSFLRNEELNLHKGCIRVEIVLSAKNMEETNPFIFRIVNPGIDRDISISYIETN